MNALPMLPAESQENEMGEEETIDVFLIRVRYKSGAIEEFECTEFSVNGKNSASWTWHGEKRPLFLNLEDVESIWQVSSRKIPKS